jgi:hypothetical protein
MRFEHHATLRAIPKFIPIAAIAAVWLGCFSTNTPASKPARNPLDDAPPAAPAEAPPQSAEEVPTKMNKFDDEQAKIVLARASASARTCVDVVDAKDQPRGEANVMVTFTGAGRSTKATANPPFEGTALGQCVTRAYVNVIVPPFDGPDVDVPVSVTLKSSDKDKSDKKEGTPAKVKKK